MIYENTKTKNISFPLGGIGTGCIGLSGNGEIKDFEIFNRPNKCTRNGYSHFAIKATANGKSVTRVLHGDTNENLMGDPCASRGHHGFGYGPKTNSLAGFPHFRNVGFEGNFPIARVTFKDDEFPAVVRLCAFNPFIPHDDFNSSLPAAFFEWEIENTSDEEIEFTITCAIRNPAKSTFNKSISFENMSGVYLGSADIDENDVEYSDLCILTDGDDTDVQEYWYRGKWQDGITTYWKNLSESVRMPQRHYDDPSREDYGTVVNYFSVGAGKKKKIRFVLAWNVPNAYNYWNSTKKKEDGSPLSWKNYYATQFKDSVESAKYALKGFSKLYDKTETFSRALQSCTIPEYVKDAISANISIIKTPTALRLADGSFWGWEGCCETVGSCHGTCQHVWNYAYVMPYLFPKLERGIRETTMKYALMDNGATSFRVTLPLVKEMDTARPCVDGQMGEVIKCYREWKFSGDDKWLKTHSENIFSMLEYAWADSNPDKWDSDMDGVIEGRQHHTLDMELFGPNSWLEGFYLLALYCGAEMAEYIGDKKRAQLYNELYIKGREWTNKNLFNGDYFCQKVDLKDKALIDSFGAAESYWNDEACEIKYQIAEGCMIDQMLADWHAALIGAQGVFDKDKKAIALKNLYKNNYKPTMRDLTNMWRNFSLNDEGGTVICSYPEGAKIPAIPVPYCEETMAGFEYALAGLMISQGFVSEGETMVKSVRDRYDGEKRNPWNEMECGSNYARSMASFALMPIYCGFTFDMTKKHIGFAPITGNGKYLFSVNDSWGMVECDENEYKILVLGNPLVLNSIAVKMNDISSVTVDGVSVDFELIDGKIILGGIKIQDSIIIK